MHSVTKCAYYPDWGSCNRLRWMWYYNMTLGTCTQFLYGGCEGNTNRFETFDQCQKECEVPGAGEFLEERSCALL